MNNVCLVGRLTSDPEVRYSPNGKGVARFRLAVGRVYKTEGSPDADFISCIAFGKTAEVIERFFVKGQEMALRGRIQTGSYTNKDGNTVYTTDVIAEEISFVGSKKQKSSDDDYGTGEAEEPKKKSTRSRKKDDEVPEGFETISEEEMPF